MLAAILGNPVMIDAYKAGIPGNGKPFPDGAKMAKIHWNPKKNETYPGQPTVPGTQHDVDFMVKDSKRFADSGGWGWGAFEYDAASDTFRPATVADKPPQGNDAKCGFSCHTVVKTTRLRFHGVRKEVTVAARRLIPGQHPKRRDHSAVSKASSHRRFSSRPCRCDTTRTRRVHLRAIAHGWHFQPLCAIVRFVPQGDLCRLAEQKRAAAEEMRRIARTLWFCTDRNRVMRRAAELEAESKWLLLDAAAVVAALLSQPAPHQQQRAEPGREKGNS